MKKCFPIIAIVIAGCSTAGDNDKGGDEKLIHVADDKRRDVRVVRERGGRILRRYRLPEAWQTREDVAGRRTVPSIGRSARENGPRRSGARLDAAGNGGGRKAAQLRRQGGGVHGGLARKHSDEGVVRTQ